MAIICIPYKGITNLIKSFITRYKYHTYYTQGLTVFIREYHTKIVGRASDIIDACLLDEPKSYNFVKKLAKKGVITTMIDLGAHIGGYSIPLSQILHKIIAIEPWPTTYNLLKLNVKINNIKNVNIINVAVSSPENKEITLCIGQNHSGSTSAHSTGSYCVQIKTITLDEIWDTYGPVDFIKIDVEGHEIEVLRGFSRRAKIVQVETQYDRIPKIKKMIKGKVIMVEKLIGGMNLYNVFFQLI